MVLRKIMEATYGRVQESMDSFYEDFLNYSAMKDGHIIDIQGDEEQGFTMVYGSYGDRRARNYDNSTELIQDFNDNLRKFSDKANGVSVFGGLMDEEGTPEERIFNSLARSDGHAARNEDEWAVDTFQVARDNADNAYMQALSENNIYLTPFGFTMEIDLMDDYDPSEAIDAATENVNSGFEDNIIDYINAATVDAVSETDSGENFHYLAHLQRDM